MIVTDYIHKELGSRKHQFCHFTDLLRQTKHSPDFEGSYVGSYSLTAPRLHTTFVSHRHTWCLEPCSASAIARAILYSGLALLKRTWIPWNKRILPLLGIPQPLYCVPIEKSRDLWYFDIKAAYFEIYRKLTLDFWYHGNFPHFGGLPFAEFLPADLGDYKMCRNSLIGVMRVTQSTRVRGYQLVPIKSRNNVLSPSHWGFIAHLLHSIANLAVGFGAVYYNTDGAIFTDLNAGLRWVNAIEALGFRCDLKAQGKGKIAAIGCYIIGSHKVGNPNYKLEPFCNLEPTNSKVLRGWEEVC